MNVLQPYETEASKFKRELASSLGGNVGQGLMQGFLSQMSANREDEAIKRLTGKDLSGLPPDLKRTFAERLAKNPELESLKRALMEEGVPESEADLYSMLTQGGQTAYIKDLLEQKKRSAKRKPIEFSESDLADEIFEEDEGLTPSERVKIGSERFKSGLPVRTQALDKIRASHRNQERFKILESLAKSKKLPSDIGRLNVKEDGSLRLPFAASPESQRFVKTINEFAAGAKDTYGSRVTNFDLAQYLKQFPSLTNSEKGIKQLIEQLKIVDEINSEYYKNLNKVFDKAGGARRIDADRAQSLAEKMSQNRVDELVSKFENIGRFTSMPEASEFTGKKIRNKETGEVLISNGRDWIPESGLGE